MSFGLLYGLMNGEYFTVTISSDTKVAATASTLAEKKLAVELLGSEMEVAVRITAALELDNKTA
eukprot:IDg7435t1